MDRNARVTQEALSTLFGNSYGHTLGVRLWDGSRVTGSEERFVLILNEPGALRAALTPPFELSAGRAFAAGIIDCDGDIESAVDALLRAASTLSVLGKIRLWDRLRRLPRMSLPALREAHFHGGMHSRARDLAAIGFHYDQPLPFYASFLDERLVYSCAYYDEGITTLAEAQLAKIDHTLRKLRLSPEDRLLDIGCGWGALVIRAAQHFGVRALGITLSQSQYDEGRRRVAQAGLEDRVSIELRDYRDLGKEQFDKIASIGMFEHVGRAKLPEYFGVAYRALRPGGLFLNHGIAAEGRASRHAPSFMERFVFPDGELVRIADALRFAQDAGFEVRGVENLREHYTKTARAWVANLERNREAAVAAAGEQSYRIWRLYMAGSAQGFRSGRIAVYQSLLARARDDGSADLPPTRRDIYA